MEHRRGSLQGEGMKDNSGEPRDFRLPYPFLSLEAQPQRSTTQATSVSWFACWETWEPIISEVKSGGEATPSVDRAEEEQD